MSLFKEYLERLKTENRMPGFIAAKRALLKGEHIGIITARANKKDHEKLIQRLEKSLGTNIDRSHVHFVNDEGYSGSSIAEKKLNVIKTYANVYDKVKFYDDEDKNIQSVNLAQIPNVKAYNVKNFDANKLNEIVKSNNRVIHLFDLDGTIWKLPAFIGIVKNGKVIKKITQEEFAYGYKLSTNESFDFSDFSKKEKLLEQSKRRRIFQI